MTTGNITSFLRKPTFLVYWLIIIIVISLTVSRNLWNQPNKIIKDDINHYYAYLPATFIYHDLSLGFVRTNMSNFSKHFWPATSPTGKWVIVTTMGLSIMYTPFFLIIHYPLYWMGYEATGYTAPYQLALILSSLFYFCIGLHLLRRILERYFNPWVSAISMFTIVMATNLLFYVVDEPAMSHSYNFVLLTAFVYWTIRWYEKPGLAISLIIGFLTGLIALIRPTNILIIIILPLWGIASWKELLDRLMFLLRKYYWILIMVISAILTWLPQMLYWKTFTGQYLYFSYGDKGKFFFLNPQVINSLFSYRKGWLVYTPIIVFALIGLIFLWKNKKSLFTPVLVFLVLNIWVISSWWLWWYGGSYGLRAYVDSYGLMAIPMAAMISWTFENRKVWMKSIVITVILIFTAHNFFQIEQYHTGAIDYVSNTRESYWESFGKIKKSDRYPHLLSYPDYKLAEQGIYPKPVLDPLYTGKLTRKEGIEVFRKQIMESPELLEMVRNKSAAQGISLDSMLYLDALCIYDMKVQAGTIVPAKE